MHRLRGSFPTRRALLGGLAVAATTFAVSYKPAPDPGWIAVERSAKWPPRDSAAVFSHNNRLWLYGGFSSNDGHPLRDGWSSADGLNWRREFVDAPWTHSSPGMSAVFNGKMWLLGGLIQSGKEFRPANQIWSSSDGAVWKLATDNAAWEPRIGATVVEFKQKLWLMGGTTRVRDPDGLASFNDVWISGDGVDWARVNAAAPWAPRAFHACVVHDGKIWIMGGGYWAKQPGLFGDIWNTDDGITWQRVTRKASWSGRIWSTASSYAGMIWVMGGFIEKPRGDANDIWFSRNGQDWQLYLPSRSWPPRQAHASIVFSDSLWVAAGSGGDFYNDVWSLKLSDDWIDSSFFPPWLRNIYRPWH
jgi:hypothetical protein